MEVFSVGIYLRLSRDDIAFGQAESNSIRSQRELTRNFVCRHSDMQIYDIYADDGYSGTSFDRPAFVRMMEDVAAGRVNCIVVKDLSRFGRDYIEAGRLIQKILPAFGVRFIAVTDHYDSFTADDNETSLVLPVKNFVNDSYCRDISCKVRSHQKVKRENGEFIGAFAVYGYRKADKNKNRLEPDAYAAQMVRNIFAWKLSGMSACVIAETLNAMGVLSPLEYKKSKGENYSCGYATRIGAEWSSAAVMRILSNEIYTGTMVQGKSEKINYKLKQCREKPKEEWVRVEHTHEPIVTREEFERVQKLLAWDCRAAAGRRRAGVFSGFLFCGDCGQPMIRRRNRYKGTEQISYICSTRNKGLGCTRHSISEKELKKALSDGIRVIMRTETAAQIAPQFVAQLAPQLAAQAASQLELELDRICTQEKSFDLLQRNLQEDLKSGVLTQEDFISLWDIYTKRHTKMQEAIRRQKEVIRAFQEKTARLREEPEQMQEFTEAGRDELLAFVERIDIYEDKRICIELKSRDPFGKEGSDGDIFCRDLCQTVR